MMLASEPDTDPWLGLLATAKVNAAGFVSASFPVSTIGNGVLREVDSDCAKAVGAVLTGVTVIATCAGALVSAAAHVGPGAPQLSGAPRSVTVNGKLSAPKYPAFGVYVRCAPDP